MSKNILLGILALPLVASALSWREDIQSPEVKQSNEISFDPLAVLAILWNPRSSASASRLYAQQSLRQFRWPHMMQIGAVTVPVSVLVNHLTNNYRSIHPVIEMFMTNVDKLSVKSTIGNAINLFTSLPVSGSELALIDALNFKSSLYPGNDIMVVSLRDVSPDDDSSASSHSGQRPRAQAFKGGLRKFMFLVTEAFMGVLVTVGLIFSILLGDIWAMVLFGSYFAHWVASTAISFNQLIIADPNLRIRKDATIVYAVYERPSGGWIVFKGTQAVMERWARTSWIFVNTVWHRIIHWVWVLSGLVASLASIANMVNMNGYLQLGFLGMLLYGSLAEVWLTTLGRGLSTRAEGFVGLHTNCVVHSKDKKFKSIIEASLGLDDDHRLGTLEWTKLGLLPARDPFTALEDVMQQLNAADVSSKGAPSPTVLEDALKHFDSRCKDLPGEEQGFVARVRQEIEQAWEKRIGLALAPSSQQP